MEVQIKKIENLKTEELEFCLLELNYQAEKLRQLLLLPQENVLDILISIFAKQRCIKSITDQLSLISKQTQ